MANGYSVDDLLDFISHASDKGLMPAATATALGVATRNVLGVLDAPEKEDVRSLDVDGAIKRFTNKRARDFSPVTLKEYGRRLHRAVELFLSWRGDPANFSVKTRTSTRPRAKASANSAESSEANAENVEAASAHDAGGYKSAFPVRPGMIVTVSNIPTDLSSAEAERLAKFIRMLASE